MKSLGNKNAPKQRVFNTGQDLTELMFLRARISCCSPHERLLVFRVSTGRKVNRNVEHIYTALNLDVTIILTLGLKLVIREFIYLPS